MDINQANITAESAKVFSGVLKTLKAMINEGEADLAVNMMDDMAKGLDVYEPRQCVICRKWHDKSNMMPDRVCKWCAQDISEWLKEIDKAG